MEDTKVFEGTVIFFKKNYGFIEWQIDTVKQTDLFVHFSDIAIEGYKTLKGGQKVSFEIGKNKNDKPKAINVKVLA